VYTTGVKFGTNVDLQNSVPARRFKFLIYAAGPCNVILGQNKNLLRDLPSLRVLASQNTKKWFWERRLYLHTSEEMNSEPQPYIVRQSLLSAPFVQTRLANVSSVMEEL
jgi:hypothetical protein